MTCQNFDVSAAAAKLRELLGQDAESFDELLDFTEQVVRREQELADARQRAEDQQAAWERERDAQVQSLREEYEHISNAWDRLEKEQRRLAIGAQSNANAESVQPAALAADSQHPSTTLPPLTGRCDTELVHRSQFQNTQSRTGEASAERHQHNRESETRAEPCPRPTVPSSFPFQQLKREIGRHTGRRR